MNGLRTQDLPRCAEAMGYLAHTPSIDPAERLTRLDRVAAQTADCLEAGGEPATAGEYLTSMQLRTWLACLPSLRATAADLPHDADTAQQSLANLQPTLHELTIGGSEATSGPKGEAGAYGLLAEVAVLGTVLWSHATHPQRAGRSIIPATPSQDRSQKDKGNGLLTGFDLLLDTQRAFVPIQVKSSHRGAVRQMIYGYNARQYKEAIAVVYLSSLIGEENIPNYESYILADALVKEDEASLVKANETIDAAVAKARLEIFDAAKLYHRPKKRLMGEG